MKRCILSLLAFLLATLVSQAQDYDTVVFSVKGGFYEDIPTLTLHCHNPEHHVRFTTNGNLPDGESPRYVGPLPLDERMYSKSNISAIRNCPEDQFKAPASVGHCIVIRAAVFDSLGRCVSATATNSYFIAALGCDLHGLPAVSLCADSLDLFDFDRGIFVEGAYYDTAKPHWSGNYYQHGREWERLSNIEFYEPDNTGINQLCGLRTHGGNGRRFQQKTLKVYARRKYGNDRFRHKFFEDVAIEQFKILVLRPFLSSNAGCEDHISNRLAQQMGLDFMADRPSVMFINGEYWGIYYVKERPDEHYVEDHYGIEADSVNVYWRWFGETENGSPDKFLSLRDFIDTADFRVETQYAYAESLIDMESFINYYILEMFIANFDWPGNNVRFWQAGNGKFRWLFYDGDSGLEFQNIDMFANAVYDGDAEYPSNRASTLFFRKLLESPRFQRQFSDRFNYLITTILSYGNTQKHYQFIKEALKEEAHLQFDRFPQMESFYPKNYRQWIDYHMEITRQFLEQRPTGNFLSMAKPSILGINGFGYEGKTIVQIKAQQFGSDCIEVFDLSGRKVYSQVCVLADGSNPVCLDMEVESGVYLVRIGDRVAKIMHVRR